MTSRPSTGTLESLIAEESTSSATKATTAQICLRPGSPMTAMAKNRENSCQQRNDQDDPPRRTRDDNWVPQSLDDHLDSPCTFHLYRGDQGNLMSSGGPGGAPLFSLLILEGTTGATPALRGRSGSSKHRGLPRFGPSGGVTPYCCILGLSCGYV